jgi:hypothetical protein
MEKEGAHLADRPRSIAVQETLSDGMRIVVQGSGERFRRLRRYVLSLSNAISEIECSRVLHAGLQPKVAETYEPIQTRNAKNLILDILDDPKNHQSHAMRYER